MLQRIAAVLTGRRTEERLSEVERAIRKLGEAERDRAATLEARHVGDSRRRRGNSRQPRTFASSRRRCAVSPGSRRAHRQLFDEIDRVAARSGPLLIGPWTGEVGFELLYWIPFVAWVRTHWNLAADRELVVSRGGVASWYGRDQAQYVDILSLFEPEEFRVAVADEKRKHRRLGAFDERVTDAVARHRQHAEIDVLHPGLMYRAFAPYWADEAGYSLISQFTRPRLMDPPVAALPSGLPSEDVAVRFYFSECFPATDENRMFARGVVSSLAERSSVVVLNPGFRADEHSDWVPDVPGRIIGIAEGMSPARNLAVQSAVIAGARSFVGYLRRILGTRRLAQGPGCRLLFSTVVQVASPACGAAGVFRDWRGHPAAD